MDSIKVLMVDDEFEYAELTKEYLEAKGVFVRYISRPELVLRVLEEESFDICLLDVKMPNKDGFTLAEEIKEKDENMPIIFLTGQTLKEHKIKGFQIGADDYITKPYSLEELYLRLVAIMRRYKVAYSKHIENQDAILIGNYTLHTQNRQLNFVSHTQRLSAIEAKLLFLLVKYKESHLKREVALLEIWGEDDYYKAKSMNVYITKLRHYLKEDKRIEILNVHGEGYKLLIKS